LNSYKNNNKDFIVENNKKSEKFYFEFEKSPQERYEKQEEINKSKKYINNK